MLGGGGRPSPQQQNPEQAMGQFNTPSNQEIAGMMGAGSEPVGNKKVMDKLRFGVERKRRGRQ